MAFVIVNNQKMKKKVCNDILNECLLSHLCDALLLLHAGSCHSPVVVVVGGVWFRSAWRRLLHHGFDCRHVGSAVSDEETRTQAVNTYLLIVLFYLIETLFIQQ